MDPFDLSVDDQTVRMKGERNSPNREVRRSDVSGNMEIEIDHIELKYALLRAGSETRLARLAAAILREGQQTPVLVVAAGADRFVLIDGYARVAALRALLRDTVLALQLDVDVVQALVLSHRMANAPRRAALEDGWLIRELIEGHGLSQAEVAKRLQRSKSWVSRRLALVRALPDSVQNAVRTGKMPAYAAGKYLVPMARANGEQCSLLIKNIRCRSISVRDVQRLYLGWRRGDAQQRLRITEDPELFLKAEEASRMPTEISAGNPAMPFITDLGIIAGVSRRAHRRLGERDFDPQTGGTGRVTRRAFDESRLAFENLAELFEESINAGPGNETSHTAP
jgi:ParB/RepB/Spo0J family partition protein|tara:strand:+ start:729 stop:1745 length:1017 start_codon:yes stop_codon:yes gene_type:complete